MTKKQIGLDRIDLCEFSINRWTHSCRMQSGGCVAGSSAKSWRRNLQGPLQCLENRDVDTRACCVLICRQCTHMMYLHHDMYVFIFTQVYIYIYKETLMYQYIYMHTVYTRSQCSQLGAKRHWLPQPETTSMVKSGRHVNPSAASAVAPLVTPYRWVMYNTDLSTHVHTF